MSSPGDRKELLRSNELGRLTYETLVGSRAARLRIMAALRSELTAKLSRPSVRMAGREIPIPRMQGGFGDPDTAYNFAGISVDAQPWTPILLELRDLVAERLREMTGEEYDLTFVLVNRYADGQDSIGPHSDDERQLGERPTIAAVSFGAERAFQVRLRAPSEAAVGRLMRADKPGKNVQTVSLASGSLLVMHDPFNKHYTHAVPKRAAVTSPRWSLTFRSVAGTAPPALKRRRQAAAAAAAGALSLQDAGAWLP